MKVLKFAYLWTFKSDNPLAVEYMGYPLSWLLSPAADIKEQPRLYQIRILYLFGQFRHNRFRCYLLRWLYKNLFRAKIFGKYLPFTVFLVIHLHDKKACVEKVKTQMHFKCIQGVYESWWLRFLPTGISTITWQNKNKRKRKKADKTEEELPSQDEYIE